MATGIFFTKAEFCKVYIYFDHLTVTKLDKLLTQTDHNIEYKTIKIINQIKGKSPQHFKFILKKDIGFKYKIIIDVMYLNKKPVFHAVDIATSF